MAVESGSYTDDVLFRRRLIAQQLAEANKQPIQHPLQGFAQLAHNFSGGAQDAWLQNEQKDNDYKLTAGIAQQLGLPAPEAAPQSPRGIDRIASLLSGTGWTPPTAQPQQATNPAGLMAPSASQGQDTPAFRGGLADRIVGAESNGVATARNPRSTATGAGQFIEQTWLDMIKSARPDLANGKSDQQLLALRNDPQLSRQMTEAYAQQNGGVLRSAGLPVTPGTTYLAHFAGPQGAVGVLQANPNHPVEAILGSKVVAANPFLKGMTAGDLRAWADRKMGGGGRRTAEADLPAPGAQQAMVPGYSPPFHGGGQDMMMPPQGDGASNLPPGIPTPTAMMQMPGGPAPLSARDGPQPGSDFAQGAAPALPYPLAASSRLPLPPPRPPGLDPASDMPSTGALPTGPASAPPPFPLDGQPEGNMNVAQALSDARGGMPTLFGGGSPQPPPMAPQPSPIQPGSAPSPSPAAAPVGGAGVSSPSAPPPSPAGQRDPRQVIAGLLANPATAPMGRAIAQQLLQSEALGKEKPTSVKEYEYAKSQGYPGSYKEWQWNAGRATEFGLNPQFGVDAQGNPVILQLGKDAKAAQAQLPEGVRLSKEPIKLDAGTHFVLLDPITRQTIATIPKENRAAAADTARGEVEGKAAGAAVEAANPALSKAQQTLATIKQLREHPGRQWATGGTFWTGAIPGTQAYDFAKLNDQAAGKAFLEAFESLKGGGAITEIEGKKASEAIARLDRAQSESGYSKALDDLEAVVNLGMERIRTRAKAAGPSPTVPALPPEGGADLDALLKKYGKK